MRFGLPEEYRLEGTSATVRDAWRRVAEHLLSLGHSVRAISLPTTRAALAAYYIIAPSEASSNLAKYDGVRYGHAAPGPQSDPLYASTRGQGFGDEVRRRVLLGTFSLSAEAIDNHFLQAQRVRRLVQGDFDAVFAVPNPLLDAHPTDDPDARVDAIICPTSLDVPPLLVDVQRQSPVEAYAGDVYTVPASLAGLPALNVPVEIQDMPDSYDGPNSVGMQVITQYGDDDLALTIGELLRPLRQSSPRN